METLELAQDGAPQRPTFWAGLASLARAATAWGAPAVALTRLPARGAAVAATEDEAIDLAGASDRFAQAVRDDSNLEMDWLWCATRVTRVQERRYCLRRALRINPASEIARRALKGLPPA